MSRKAVTTTTIICDGCDETAIGDALPDGWVSVGGFVEQVAEGKTAARITVVGQNADFHSVACMASKLQATRDELDTP